MEAIADANEHRTCIRSAENRDLRLIPDNGCTNQTLPREQRLEFTVFFRFDDELALTH